MFQGRSYTYVGMPFGLKNAPLVFTKVMRAVMWRIRRKWYVRCAAYLDDLLFVHQDREQLQQMIVEIQEWLNQLGWTINVRKSEVVPAQVFHFLGWEWDTVGMCVKLGEEKRLSLLSLLDAWTKKMKRAATVRVKDLAALVGSLNATRLQFEKASLYLVKMNRLKNIIVRNSGWDGSGVITPMIGGEIEWWKGVLERNTPKWLLPDAKPQGHLWVDASPSGWGAWAQTSSGREYAFGVWPTSIQQQTNNFRELYAVIMGIKRFAPLFTPFQVRHVALHSDNTSVVFNIRRRAASRNLYHTLRLLLNLCDQMHIHLSVQHIAGVRNTTADSLSRISRSGDYQLSQAKFREACTTLGVTPQVDLFATPMNTKIPIFLSPMVGTATVVWDAMAIPWTTGLPFVHPPIPLIGRCLQKILWENIPAVIVVPDWRGQSWSVLLSKMTAHKVILGKSQEILQPGRLMTMKGDKLPPGYLAAHLLTPPFSI
jgi:ribonuclease HI